MHALALIDADLDIVEAMLQAAVRPASTPVAQRQAPRFKQHPSKPPGITDLMAEADENFAKYLAASAAQEAHPRPRL